MQVGSFGPVVFEVTDKKVFTPDSRSRTNTSNWATHDRIEGKSRSQYLSPGLTQVQYKVRIRADMGMRPQATIDLLHALAQSRQVYPLFMGGVPFQAERVPGRRQPETADRRTFQLRGDPQL